MQKIIITQNRVNSPDRPTRSLAMIEWQIIVFAIETGEFLRASSIMLLQLAERSIEMQFPLSLSRVKKMITIINEYQLSRYAVCRSLGRAIERKLFSEFFTKRKAQKSGNESRLTPGVQMSSRPGGQLYGTKEHRHVSCQTDGMCVKKIKETMCVLSLERRREIWFVIC